MSQTWIRMVALAALVCGCLPGCGSRPGQGASPSDRWKKITGPSPTERVAMAFDPADADRRREGIAALTKKSWGLAEPHLKGYAALLKMDESAPVRSAAARALGKAGRRFRDQAASGSGGQADYEAFCTKYVPALAAALADEAPSVRWDAAVALDGALRPGAGAVALDPLRKHAMADDSVDVRIACATALRHFSDRMALMSLVACLSDPNFGVRYHAHASLVQLAGRDVGYEPKEWDRLLEKGRPGGPATQPGGPGRRPWWDWFGATGTNHAPAADEPATAPAGRNRRFWDWLRPRRAESQVPDGAAAAGQQDRPTTRPAEAQ